MTRSFFCLLLLSGFPLLFPEAGGSQARPGGIPAVAHRDTLLIVRPGDSLSSIAARFLSLSPSYTRQELLEEIRRRNGLASDRLLPGQEIRVPVSGRSVRNRTVPRPRDFEARGIYLNAQTAGSGRVRELVARLLEAGGNSVVFDVKDRQGNLSYLSQVDLAVEIGASEKAAVQQPAKLIDFLHGKGIHVVARLVCFYDARLARMRPDLVPLSRKSWGTWSEKGEPTWVDPSLPEVQEYLLALVREVAAMGVDEIQLDYLRFPTEGDVEDALFAFDPAVLPRHEVIASFLEQVRAALDSTGVLLSADIFGVVAWGRKVDEESTGQKLSALLPYLDVVSPMLYPSHFYGSFDQIPRPVDYPYFVVYRGCRQIREAAQKYGVTVRPWIQAFPYRVARFDAQYVTEQLFGARDGGARGWMLWNSSSRYETGLAAIERFVDASADSLSPGERFPEVEAAVSGRETNPARACPCGPEAY